jgi:hypothetical protein
MAFTDRSRTLTYQKCPRARWWEYEYLRRGLAPLRLSIPLAVGTYVHVGLGVLLEQARDERPVDIEEAVQAAHNGYRELIDNRGIAIEDNRHMAFTFSEQKAMIEALIRIYALRKLPQLKAQYRVVETEREDLLHIGWATINRTDESLIWMARADGLLEEISSGDLYLMSFKTAADWDARKEAENNHDMQGLSEWASVQGRLNKDWESTKQTVRVLGVHGNDHLTGSSYRRWLNGLSSSPRIMGVKMEFLLKGERRKNNYTDRYEQYSPLVRAWRQPGITSSDDTYAWRYEWEGEDGKKHRLGKGWEPFYAWELPGGVKKWISLLDQGKVQPEAGDCLEQQFIFPAPYLRHESDIARWQRQVSAQERQVAIASAAINARLEAGATFDDIEEELDEHFPQYTRSCDWPVKCSDQDLCWGSAEIADAPLQSGIYTIRTPHHTPELEKFQEQEKKAA